MRTENVLLNANDVIHTYFENIFNGSWKNRHKMKPVINTKTVQLKSTTISNVKKNVKFDISENSQEFKLELDSHANMHVMGKGAHVEYTGKTADVNAFSHKYKTPKLPIVDAVIQYV